MLHDNLFDNQGTEKNKNDIFRTFRHTVFYENFLPTLLYSLCLSTCTEEATEMAAKYLHNIYRNGCEIFAQQKNVFLIIFEKKSHIIIITVLKKIYIYKYKINKNKVFILS